jgi:hypothetical protein
MASEYLPRYPFLARLLTGAAWLWCFFALVYFTDAACPFTVFGAMALSGLLIGAVWSIQTAIWPHLIRRLPWLSVPPAGLLACALLLTDWGLALRVTLSETALNSRAADAIAAGIPDRIPRYVGLFHVDEVQVFDGGVYFYTTWSFLNRHGVARLPEGSRPAPRTSVQHLHGSWYSFEWRF